VSPHVKIYVTPVPTRVLFWIPIGILMHGGSIKQIIQKRMDAHVDDVLLPWVLLRDNEDLSCCSTKDLWTRCATLCDCYYDAACFLPLALLFCGRRRCGCALSREMRICRVFRVLCVMRIDRSTTTIDRSMIGKRRLPSTTEMTMGQYIQTDG
jgi:hypothetical protein